MSTFLLDFADKIADRDDDVVAGEIEASAFLASSNATGSDFTDENEYCSIPTEIFGNFSAKGFQNTNIIKWMNSIPPRFGRTSDVLDLVIGTEQQQRGMCFENMPIVHVTVHRVDAHRATLYPTEKGMNRSDVHI